MALFYNGSFTDKVYMKNTQFRPKTSNLSLIWEKINTIIERDLALIMIIMIAGLLHTDQYGMRGFPLPWFSPSQSAHMHSSIGAFITSLLCAAVMVAVGEILNAVFRRGSEPTSLRTPASQVSVYANTYDDTHEFQDIPDTGAFERKDARNYSKALQKNQKLFRKIEATVNSPLPVRTKYVMGHDEKIVLRIVLAIFAASIIIIGAISGAVLTQNGLDDDIASDDYDTEYTDDSYDNYESLMGTPFFDDNEYLQGECDRVIEMLKSGDEEGLAEIGDGDIQGLLGLTDWSGAEYNRDYRYAVSGDPDYGFIRFLVTSGDDKYMLGIKFAGDGLATDEEKAVVTGISACTFEPWKNLDYEDDDVWTKFENEVKNSSIVIGDGDFMGYSILTW